MKASLLLICTIIGIASTSCSPHPVRSDDGEVTVYDLSSPVKGAMEDVFSDVSVIPLRFEKDTYPGTTHQLRVSDSILMITDRYAFIHLFDRNGHYLSCSKDRFGQGPEEYAILMGAFFNDYTRNIDIITPDRIISFDNEFNLLLAHLMPTKTGEDNSLFKDGFPLSSHSYLLIPTTSSVDPWHIAIWNNENPENLLKIHYNKNDVISPSAMQGRYLFPMPDGELVFIAPAFTGAIYSLDLEKRSLSKIISFKYREPVISKSDVEPYRDNLKRLSQYLATSKKSYPEQHLITPDLIFILIRTGMTMRDCHSIVIDRRTGESRRIDLYEDGTYVFPFIMDVDTDHAYAIYTKEFLLEHPRLLMDRADDCAALLDSIDDEDFAVLKYHIR